MANLDTLVSNLGGELDLGPCRPVNRFLYAWSNGYALLLRLSGSQYEQRHVNIATVNATPSKVQLQIERRLEGPGKGGLEVISYLTKPKPVNRLSLLLGGTDNALMADRIGSCGWIPSNYSPVLRRNLMDGDSVIAGYKVDRYGIIMEMMAAVIVWGLTVDQAEHSLGALTSSTEDYASIGGIALDTGLEYSYVDWPGYRSLSE